MVSVTSKHCKYECCDWRYPTYTSPTGCPEECLDKQCKGDKFCSDNPGCKYHKCVHCDTPDDCDGGIIVTAKGGNADLCATYDEFPPLKGSRS